MSPTWPALLAALHAGGAAAYYWRKTAGSDWFTVGAAPPPPATADVYFGVNPTERAAGRRFRGTVAAINCLYAEFDAKDFSGDKAAALAHVDQLRPAPAALVDSGGGFHAYWLLAASFRLDTPEARAHAADVQRRWVAFVGGDRAACDLARVLRVPGTRNTKYTPARPVDLLRCDLGVRFDLAALAALLPSEPAPQARPARPAAPVAAQRGESVIAVYNAAGTPEALAEELGAVQGPSGWRCNCGVAHTGPVQFVITSGGRFIFFSERCAWAAGLPRDRNGRPFADRFALHTNARHNGDTQAAVATLRAQQPRRAPNYPPHPAGAVERRHTAPEAAAARRLDAERKRAQRQQTVAATRERCHDRMVDDTAAPERARDVLYAMLAEARGIRCRPSKTHLAARLSCAARTIQRALAWLEGRYIQTEQHANAAGERWSGGDAGTPWRTFLREPLRRVETLQSAETGETAPDAGLSPKVVRTCDLRPMQEAGEGGAATPAPASDPAVLADAEWAALLAGPAPAPDEPPSASDPRSEPAPAADTPVPPTAAELPAGYTLRRTCGRWLLRGPGGTAAWYGAEAEALAALGDAAPPPAPVCEQVSTPADGDLVAAGQVSFAGGASFDPAAAPRRRLRDTAGLDWHLDQLNELYRQHAARFAPAPSAPVDAQARLDVDGPPPAPVDAQARVNALEAELAAAERAAKDAGRAYGQAKARGDKTQQTACGKLSSQAKRRVAQLRERIATLRGTGMSAMLAIGARQGAPVAPPHPPYASHRPTCSPITRRRLIRPAGGQHDPIPTCAAPRPQGPPALLRLARQGTEGPAAPAGEAAGACSRADGAGTARSAGNRALWQLTALHRSNTKPSPRC